MGYQPSYRIIKHGHSGDKYAKFTCNSCGCLFEVAKRSVEWGVKKCTVECPDCNNLITVDKDMCKIKFGYSLRRKGE